MPRIYDYPMASFKKSLEIAEAVDALGGNCSFESCASKLAKQATSGGFRQIVTSAVKHGLINFKKGHLHITDEYKLARLAYTQAEKQLMMRQFFLRPKVYAEVYSRFVGREMPIGMLDKLLVREFSVEENMASRVSNYLVDGLKHLELMNAGNMVQPGGLTNQSTSAFEEDKDDRADEGEKDDALKPANTQNPKKDGGITGRGTDGDRSLQKLNPDSYIVRITGPGLENTIEITEEDDLLIVQAFLNKIKKALSAAEARNSSEALL